MAKHKPYRIVIYIIARLFAAILYSLPRRVLLFIARGLGSVAYSLLSQHRNDTLQNLRMGYGDCKTDAEIQSIAKDVFINLAQTAAEMLQYPKLNSEKTERFVNADEAYQIYSKLLSEGKGLIALTSHIGNWELLGGIFTMKGFKGKAIARKLRFPPFHRWIESLRKAIKVDLFYREETSLKALSDWLAKGGLLGILPDQDIASVRGVFVKYFGKPAYTTDAPVRLALLTSTPIVTVFLIRLPQDKYKVVIGEVIRPVIKTTQEAALHEYTQQWMSSCEKIIRQYPGQWGWNHNRWKTQKSEIKSLSELRESRKAASAQKLSR